MGYFTRHALKQRLAVAAIAAVLPMAPVWAAGEKPQQPQAGEPPSAQAAAQKASELAKRAYEAGAKSYSAGKYQPAVDALSAALRGGGLQSAEMARALYLRGLAYKKLSKPGLAISDLTSALWLKNGLSEADRKSATSERAEAYKQAGLGDGNTGADEVAVNEPAVPGASTSSTKAPATPPAAAPAARAPVPAPVPQASAAVTTGAAKASSDGVPQPLSMVNDVPAPPPATASKTATDMGEAQVAALEQPRVIAGSSTPTTAGGPVNQAAALEQPLVEPTKPAPPSATVANPANPNVTAGQTQNKSSVAGFFSNLFSSGSSEAQQAPAPPVTTASTAQTAQTSSWTAPATAAPAGKPAKDAKQVVAAAEPPAPPVPAAAPAVKGGKFKAHIAAFRSRAEADALAQKLAAEHAAALASRAPTVDEAVIGSMGKFFRVRVGSYATADETRGLCNTLRNSGYDCLVVSN